MQRVNVINPHVCVKRFFPAFPVWRNHFPIINSSKLNHHIVPPNNRKYRRLEKQTMNL